MNLFLQIEEEAEREKGLPLEKRKERVSDLLDKAVKLLPKKSELDSSSYEYGIAVMSQQGLWRFRDREDGISHLGEWGVLLLATKLAAGAEREAALIYLQEKAGWDELFGAVDTAQQLDMKAKVERDRIRNEALKKVKEIGGAAARVALPFLLAAVGT